MLANRKSMEGQKQWQAKLSDEAFLAVLQAHPGLRARIVSTVSAIENSKGDLKEVDAVEERIVEEMRLLGREALQGWAGKQVEVTEGEIRQQLHMHRQGKKSSLAYHGTEVRLTTILA
jgi:hypothetical protein